MAAYCGACFYCTLIVLLRRLFLFHQYIAFETVKKEIFVCSRRAAQNMSYQGFTAEDGKYDVLLELTGQVLTEIFDMFTVTLFIHMLHIK